MHNYDSKPVVRVIKTTNYLYFLFVPDHGLPNVPRRYFFSVPWYLCCIPSYTFSKSICFKTSISDIHPITLNIMKISKVFNGALCYMGSSFIRLVNVYTASRERCLCKFFKAIFPGSGNSQQELQKFPSSLLSLREICHLKYPYQLCSMFGGGFPSIQTAKKHLCSCLFFQFFSGLASLSQRFPLLWFLFLLRTISMLSLNNVKLLVRAGIWKYHIAKFQQVLQIWSEGWPFSVSTHTKSDLYGMLYSFLHSGGTFFAISQEIFILSNIILSFKVARQVLSENDYSLSGFLNPVSFWSV